MTATQALHAAILAALDTGQRPPCIADRANRHLWTSNKRDERDQAAELCAPCPVLAECLEAGRGEKAGVWGGRSTRTGAAA